MSKVMLEDLSDEMQRLFSEYGDEVMHASEEAVKSVSKEARKKLKSSGKFKNRTGEYRKGWKIKIVKTRTGTAAKIYNKDHYRLAHLLEFGHSKKSGGRTQEFPHIGEVNAWAQDEFVKEVKERLE